MPRSTRRHFGRLALHKHAGARWRPPGLTPTCTLRSAILSSTPTTARSSAACNFACRVCYRRSPDRTGKPVGADQRLVQNGFGLVELHATWVERAFHRPSTSTGTGALPGVRLSTRSVKINDYSRVEARSSTGRIMIFTSYVNINKQAVRTPDRYRLRSTKMLRARGCMGSRGSPSRSGSPGFSGRWPVPRIHNRAELLGLRHLQHRAQLR